MRDLTEQQKEFLKNYRPKSTMYTSASEALQIIENLQLIEAEQQDVDLKEYRSQILSYYDEISKNAEDYIANYMDSVTSIQSVMNIFAYGIRH